MSRIKVSVFSQILQVIDRQIVYKCIRKHDSDKYAKGINTWAHMVCMLFCHLAKVGGIRDITNGLSSSAGNLNHLNMQFAPSKSSISYINKNRTWEVFKDIYMGLLEKLEPSLQQRRKYAHRLKRKIFIMDSSTISLCLSLFDWAKYKRRKGAIKLHTILDYDTCLPTYMYLTDGKKHDVTVAKELIMPSGSVIVMDRAYVDFKWLFKLDSTDSFFVTRLKKGTLFEVAESFLTDDKKECILSDQDIRLLGKDTSIAYPKKLRVVRVYDERNGQVIHLLTNNMFWTAQTISELYNARWDIEVFFKTIKQSLKIKEFIGLSENAVLIQVWTAMITILLLKYLQNKAKHSWHLSNLVGLLRIHLFSKINIFTWLDKPFLKNHDPPKLATLF